MVHVRNGEENRRNGILWKVRSNRHGRHLKKCCAPDIDWKLRHEKAVPMMGHGDVSVECLAVINPIRNHEWNMDLSFYTWDEETVRTIGRKGKISFKKSKVVPSVSKLITSVCWDTRRIIFIDYLEKEEAINGLSFDKIKKSVVLLQCINLHIGYRLPPHEPDLIFSDYSKRKIGSVLNDLSMIKKWLTVILTMMRKLEYAPILSPLLQRVLGRIYSKKHMKNELK